MRDYDDPVWEYTLVTRLMPYIEAVDNFWAKIFRIFMKLRKFFGMEVNCCENPDI